MTETQAILNAPNHGERVRLAVDALGGIDRVETGDVVKIIERAGVSITRQTVWARLNDMRSAFKQPETVESEPPQPEDSETQEDKPAENQPQKPAEAAPAAKPEPQQEDRKRLPIWPLFLILLSAFVAVWSGWVGLGAMVGFGPVNLLPGMGDGFTIDTSITLPLGMEAYGGYALYVWLSGRAAKRARVFAAVSALVALGIGASGQMIYHQLAAAGITTAPMWVTSAVSVLPVAVVGMTAALIHMANDHEEA